MQDHHQEEVQSRWERTKRRDRKQRAKNRLPDHVESALKSSFWLWVIISGWRTAWFMASGGFLVAGAVMLMTLDETAAVSAEAYRQATRINVGVMIAAILSLAILLAFWRRYKKYSRNDE